MINETKATIGLRVIETGAFLLAIDFLNSANNFLRLLSEVDIALSPSFARTAEWSIKELSRQSPAVLTVEALIREGQVDDSGAIIDTVMEGISSLKQSDNRPRYFSDQALASARDLVSVLGERIHQVEIFTPKVTVMCTETIAANIREILHPGRETIGSVEGYVESMNSHRGFVFGLYEPVLSSRIECELDSSLESEAVSKLKIQVYSLYEQKVRVSGMLRTNRKGEVRTIKVSSIAALRTEPMFKDAKTVSGIFDITGGLDASEYVGRMRNA